MYELHLNKAVRNTKYLWNWEHHPLSCWTYLGMIGCHTLQKVGLDRAQRAGRCNPAMKRDSGTNTTVIKGKQGVPHWVQTTPTLRCNFGRGTYPLWREVICWGVCMVQTYHLRVRSIEKETNHPHCNVSASPQGRSGGAYELLGPARGFVQNRLQPPWGTISASWHPARVTLTASLGQWITQEVGG